MGAEIEVRPGLVECNRGLGQELGKHLPGALGEVWERAGEEEVRNGGERVLVGGGGNELA